MLNLLRYAAVAAASATPQQPAQALQPLRPQALAANVTAELFPGCAAHAVQAQAQ